ncbi:MAG: hypothetical protein WD044_10655 [Dongiaceae bacterium]
MRATVRDYFVTWLERAARHWDRQAVMGVIIGVVLPLLFALAGLAIGLTATGKILWLTATGIWAGLYLFIVVPYQIWKDLALKYIAQEKLLNEFQNVRDHSGRNLVSIRDAIGIVMTNMSDQWPSGANEGKRRFLAARKLRELAFAGIIEFWGRKQFEHPDGEIGFHDIPTVVPASCWEACQIDIEAVFGRCSGDDNPELHMKEDRQYEIQKRLPVLYGNLKVNRQKVEVACPQANTQA